MKIGTREVGPGAPVFVIAECGSNHAGSLEAALALIDAAADAGADAAKFQRFRVGSFIVPRENPEALRPYELPDAWLPVLRDRCARRGIEFLCTAFDFDSLEAVDPYVNAHKIGSYEATRRGFVVAAISTHKPVIASEGLCAVPGADVRLRCVSKYPADVDGYLNTLPLNWWGVSDHTLDPITVPAAAVALGACVVEKHLRLDEDPVTRTETTPSGADIHWHRHQLDYGHSITAEDFRRMVEAIMRTSRALGRAA